MTLHHWLRKLLRSTRFSTPSTTKRRARQTRLLLEGLESRIAPANRSGDITTNTTWSNTEVQTIVGTVHVDSGVTLTIQAGTSVQSTGSGITVDGTLNASGSSGQQIIFTSSKDNSPTGGSNNAAAGDWSDLQFNADSTGNVLNDVQIRYAGSFGAPAVLDNGAPLTMSNSLVSFSNAAGVRVENLGKTSATFDGNSFQNNHNAAMSMDLDSNPTIINETPADFSNNQYNGMRVDDGATVENLTWNNPDIAYVINGPTVAKGMTLKIDAGQIIKSTGGTLTVDGTLDALGTATSPVIFTSVQDDSASTGGNSDTNNDGGATSAKPGDWEDLLLNADSSGNSLIYVDVLYSGGFSDPAVYANGAPLTMSNCLVSNGAGAGLRLVQSTARVNANSFQNNAGPAIRMDLQSNPTYTDETGADFTKNQYNGVLIDDGTTSQSLTWNNPEIVYTFNAITVGNGTTLTIGPGQIVKVMGTVTVDGTLSAQGTAAQPVIFTSLHDDRASSGGDTDNDNGAISPNPGDWNTLLFKSDSTNNVLDHVEVLYAGSFGAPAVDANGGPLTLSNSIVSKCGNAGVGVAGGAQAQMFNDIIFGNAGQGIKLNSGSVTAFNNTLDSNNRGVEVDAGTLTLTNNLITNSSDTGVVVSGTPMFNLSFNDVFKSANQNYNGVSDPTGTNGNISADPLYVSGSSPPYQLGANSPAISAGTSTNAPTKDFFDNPRKSPPSLGAFESGSQLPPAPTVTSVTPSAGPTAGGQTVTITGTNLANATQVDFGFNNVTSFVSDTSTQIVITTPAEPPITVDVQVITAGGASPINPSTDQYTFVAPPTVTSVTPNQGTADGGTTVTISGANLDNATEVDFGSDKVPSSSFTSDSTNTIVLNTPASEVGTVDVRVVTAGGTSAISSADQFTFVDTSGSGQLTLTSPGTADGFTLTTFATGYVQDKGPLGITFTPGGGVMVADASDAVRVFPTDTDNQNAGNITPGGTFPGYLNAEGLAHVGSTFYLTQQGNGEIAQLNADGSFNQNVIGLSYPVGIVVNPANGHLLVAAQGLGTIVDVNLGASPPTYGTVVPLNADGLAITPDGTELYAAIYFGTDSGHVLGFSTSTWAQNFDSGAISGHPDGIALLESGGSLAGDLVVNTNGGTVILVNPATNAQTVIASGGTRGDFAALDSNNGSVLLTQSTAIDRLIPPSQPAPTVQFSTTSETVNASDGSFSITVTENGAQGAAVTVPFALGGSAKNGTDYSGVTNSPLTIPAGQTSATITGTLLSDPGPNQTLTFTLQSPVGAVLGSPSVNTLTIDEPSTTGPSVNNQPASVTVDAGQTATFTSSATGSPTPTVQWEVNTGSGFVNLSNGGDYSGVTTDTLTVSGVTTAMSGDQYEAVFTNSAGSTTSNSATLTVNALPTLGTLSPSSATEGVGYSGTIPINGGTGPFTIQNSSGLDGLTAGISGSNVTITGTAPTSNVNFSITVGDITGATVQGNFTLTVNPPAPPTVTGQPSSVTVDAGQTATFTSSASGAPTPTVQWEVNAGSGFVNLNNGGDYSGVTTDTLTVSSVTTAMSGYQYEAVFTNLGGSTPSHAATLTVNPLPTLGALSPAAAVMNQGYSGTIAIAGGTGPFSIQGSSGLGGLSAGISGANVTITGTAPASNVNFSVTVKDSTGATVQGSYTLKVNPPAPTIANLSPQTGSASGGTSVTITGTNLGTAATATVSFGGTTVSPSSDDGSTLVVAAPPGTPGSVTVSVTTAGGSATAAQPFFYTAGPTATFSVTLVRANSTVLSLTSVAAAEGLLSTPSEQGAVYAASPAAIDYLGAGGDGHSNLGPDAPFPGTTSTSQQVSLFAVQATANVIIPGAGNWTFGTSSDDGVGLTVGGLKLQRDGVFPPTDTFATYNFTSAGTYALDLIYYQNQGGAEVELFAAQGSFTSFNSSFVLVGDTAHGGLALSPTAPPAPTVIGISPPSGPVAGGTAVTITGTNLANATEVDFGAVAVSSSSFIGQTSATITLNSPVATAAGTVDVRVFNPSGPSPVSSTDQFTYLAPSGATVQFATGSETVNESAGTFSIAVTLSSAASSSVSVPFTMSGSATAGSDYSGVTASPLVFPAGQMSATITGTLLADPGASPNLIFTLGAPTDASLGSPSVNTLTITEPAGTAPSVLAVTPSTTVITTAQVGGTFRLAIAYSAAMSRIQPTITFSPSVASALSFVSGAWTSARVYTASYKITRVAATVPGVFVTVTGAQDTSGHTQVDFTSSSSVFSIDTANPTVTSLVPSAATVTDAQLGRETFALAIVYSTAMNTNINPTVSLSASANSTLSLASASWNTATMFSVVYNVADVFVSVPHVSVTVSGARDTSGDTQTPSTGTFAIDTVNPTVKAVAPSTASITGAQEGNGTFSLTVVYSGPMNTVVPPTIGFIPPIDSTLSPSASGTWNSAGTSFTQIYNVADSGMSIAGVAVVVSGGQNSDGNLQHPFEKTNAFTINTINPTVLSATPSTTNITSHGNNAFKLTIAYSTPMNLRVAPTISFTPDVSSTLQPGTGSGWNRSHTMYTAVYNVAAGFASFSGVTATISGGESSSSSVQLLAFQSSPFSININGAGSSNISVTAYNTTAGISADYFGESFVPTVSGPLTQLNILNVTGLYNPQAGFVNSTTATIEIYQGGINTIDPHSPSYDTPAGPLLYSQKFTFTTGTSSIVFTTPPVLTAGHTYLWRVVPDNVVGISVLFATNNPYKQGDTLAGPGFGYDLDFQAFV
jgi:hypothetical protein